jgi:hypothetical protein
VPLCVDISGTWIGRLVLGELSDAGVKVRGLEVKDGSQLEGRRDCYIGIRVSHQKLLQDETPQFCSYFIFEQLPSGRTRRGI